MKEIMKRYMKENLPLVSPYLPSEKETLSGKTVLITGATGLIGVNLAHFLSALSEELEEPIRLILQIRDLEKAREMIGEETESLTYAPGDLASFSCPDGKVDYMIHAGSMTGSRDFVERPVEVIETAYAGTKHALEIAREKRVKGFIYLSTMEVYGAPKTREKISETHGSTVLTTEVRSSYPESKRLAETLCCAYCAEYDVPSSILRLTQTFGPGVRYDDGRVFAYLARCAKEKEDIVLLSKGETCRSYLSAIDACCAVLHVMLRGRRGESYNAANEETYCSIWDMAGLVAGKIAGGEIKVSVREEDPSPHGFAPTLYMDLDCRKLRELGFHPVKDLRQMYEELLQSWS